MQTPSPLLSGAALDDSRLAHTPGPWYFHEGVVMPDGETYEDDGVTVYRGLDWQRGIAQLVKNRADGQLIAAAPDLLAIAQTYLNWIDSPAAFDPSLVEGLVAQMRAAVAKAVA
jgi:hypothetical protein